jgi:hypothetical protein
MKAGVLHEVGGGLTVSAETMGSVYAQVVGWARSGELAVEKVPLGDVESAWQRADLRGRRIVVIP